jgi:HEPN domain-containing protein
MPPDATEGEWGIWLARAKSSLLLARQGPPAGVFLEDICYHAQQAAEKALKALFVAHGLRFRYTHDIKELITGLQHQQISVPKPLYETVMLTRYAIETRYPYNAEAVTEDELRQAIAYAERVVAWVDREITDMMK